MGEKAPIPPALEKALSRLAKETVANGWDVGKVLAAVMRAAKFRQEVWPTLTDEQKRGVLAELRRRGKNPVPRVVQRKPRRFRNEIHGD